MKASNGFWHSFAFTSGKFPDPLRIKAGNRTVAEDQCRRCHAPIVAAMDGAHRPADQAECLHCHRDVGHVRCTLGILTGMGLSMASYDRPIMFLDPKQVFPLLAWALFAGVLLARLARGFRGRKAAYLTIAGFVLGLLTIAGIPS